MARERQNWLSGQVGTPYNSGGSYAHYELAKCYDGERGHVPGLRIQTGRNSLHMPLDQFLQIAQQVILSQGGLVLPAEYFDALETVEKTVRP